MKNFCISIISFFVGVLFVCVMVSNKNSTNTTYYQPAEVIAYNETSVYFATPDGNIYHFEIDSAECPDTVPYLLDMDSMGTDDISDDEIIVVWKCAK